MITANLKKKPFFFIVCVLVLTSMACRFSPTTSTATATPITIEEDLPSTETGDVESLLEDMQQHIGTFAFTVTEEEMVSYLTLKMSENQELPQVDNLDVKFRDNQITLSGDVFVENLGIKVPAELVLVAKVDETGQLYFELVSVSVANMVLPASLEEMISDVFTDLMNSKFTDYLRGYKIDTVYVNGGMLTISGQKR